MVTNRNTRYARYERKLYSVRKTKHKRQLVLHGIVMMLIMVIGLRMCLVQAMDKEQEQEVVNDVSTTNQVVQSTIPKQVQPQQEETVEQRQEQEIEKCPKFEYSKDWDANDSYLLAKIAMAEAEGCSTQTKTLVILVVLNRVWSDQFPDTIHDVIFEQCDNGTYQFSPIGNGRWDRVEPNEDCYEAVDIVMESIYDYSGGAL